MRGSLALLFAAAFLAACETAEDGAGNGPGNEAPAPQVSIDAGEPPPEVAALPADPEVDDDPDRLIGLGRDGLYEILGMPELVRRESPAQVWQYRSVSCVFDVFLYEDGADSRVTYVEARDSHGTKRQTRQCLNELLRARLRPG